MGALSASLCLSESVPMTAVQEAEYMKAETETTMTATVAKSPEIWFALANWAILHPSSIFASAGYMKINNRFILSTR